MAHEASEIWGGKAGILPDTEIAALAEAGRIAAETPFAEEQIQPASLDLRLGAKAWRLRASFLPGAGKSVEAQLGGITQHEIDLTQDTVLETGCVYLARLEERLSLPQDIAAAANPKSSIGRLDIFTRLITDGGVAFDTVPAGYSGPLYLEISPRSFPVLARRGARLAQMRFRCGEKDRACAPAEHGGAAGLALSVDLAGGQERGRLVGYRARRHSPLVDIDKADACAAEDFWQPIYHSGQSRLVLDPNEFYILASCEAVRVPPLFAAEMTPFDPLIGEFRVHYAGFFDPGFGCAEAGGAGAKAVLEVRSHEVPFILEHRQTIGRLVYEPMRAEPRRLYGAGLHSHYQAQGLKLSKHFKNVEKFSAQGDFKF